MATEYAKILPVPDPDSRAFWDACKQHQLKAQRCSKCGRFRWPPNSVCPGCFSWDFEWVQLSGRGVVESFVVPHDVRAPGFKDEAPYVVAHIVMDGTDGNVRITSNVIGCSWEDVRVGMPVEVTFEDATEDITLHKFKPA